MMKSEKRKVRQVQMEWFKKIIEDATDENGNINIDILVKEFNTEFKKNAVLKSRYDEEISRIEEEKDGEIQRLKENERRLLRESAVDLALTKAGARSLKAAKALLEIEEDADEETINDKIRSLAENEESSFLFEKNEEFFGSRPDEGADEGSKSLDEMSYSEMCRYLGE